MNNFWQRTLTGAIFLVVMIGGITWSYWSLCILFFLIAMLGLKEYYELLEKSGREPQKVYGLLAGGIIFILFAISNSLVDRATVYLCFSLFAILFFIELFREKQTPYQNIAQTLTGIIYIIVPFALWVNFLKPHSDFTTSSDTVFYNPHILLGYFFILWTNDTMAYLTGKAFGKHKLWERISPKKTWEGFIGGMVFSIGIGFLISRFFTEYNYQIWMLMAFFVCLFGTLGDLVESSFKRSLDVKDSGSILPGHGGILDRFDGVLLSTPFVLFLLQMVEVMRAVFAA